MAAILRAGVSSDGGDDAGESGSAPAGDGEVVVVVPTGMAELEEQCMTLVKQHALFSEALDAFKDMPARRYVDDACGARSPWLLR